MRDKIKYALCGSVVVLLVLLSLGVVYITVCTDETSLITDEVEARTFVDQASGRLYAYYNNLNHDRFTNNYKEVSDEKRQEEEKLLRRSNLLVRVVKDSKDFDYTQFVDKELKYVFEKIQLLGDDESLGEDMFVQLMKSTHTLSRLDGNRDIEAYQNSSVQLAYFPDIQNIIAKSDDPEELKYYWSAWRARQEGLAPQHLLMIIELMKVAANKAGISLLTYGLKGCNMTEMENIMTQTQPLYSELHAFIRNQLLKKYGEDVIKPNGPIPDHLFQQVLAQAWTNGSIIDEIFPHKELPAYDSLLEKSNYDALKLYKTADMFYQSLGFEAVPDDLWANQIKMKKNEDVGDCRASVYTTTPNVYMEYCHKMDFRTFLQAHGYLGSIHYAREMNNLPAYYFHSYGLDLPLGEAVTLSASTSKHMKAIGLANNFKFTNKSQLNRLLRMCIQTLLNMRLNFVHMKVMADLYDETIDVYHLNKHYWSLMDKYVGVEPPTDRNQTAFFDFPPNFYVDINSNLQYRQLYSQVMSYQLYKKFCEISGQYPKESLQNCDFYNSTSVGDAMKNMMKLGSTKDVRDVLSTILTNNPSLSAASLLEYYRPVKNWIADKNRKTMAKLRWTQSKKKVVFNSLEIPRLGNI